MTTDKYLDSVIYSMATHKPSRLFIISIVMWVLLFGLFCILLGTRIQLQKEINDNDSAIMKQEGENAGQNANPTIRIQPNNTDNQQNQ